VDPTAFLKATRVNNQSNDQSKPNSQQENTCSEPKIIKKPEYNVYGEEINPENLMPINPNQLPVPGQIIPLSTQRAKSNIPKGGTESETWTYPSPQMFYNALSRKNKADGIKEQEIDMVVSIHNNMNEHTWNEVLRWENKYCSKDCPVSLLKFRGRPHELSPTAKVRSWFGYGRPFDRHDWIVDRCGKEIRYIIDYYYNEQDPLKVTDPLQSNITVHVRPALDSFQSTYDRFTARIRRIFGQPDRKGGYSSPPPLRNNLLPVSTKDSPEPLSDDEFKFFSEYSQKSTELITEIQVNCGELIERSLDPHEPEIIHAAVDICVGRIICPKYASEWEKLATNNATTNEQLNEAYFRLQSCVQRFAIKNKT